MALVEKTYYKVELKGEVTIEALSEDDAIAKARTYFISTGQGVSWAVTQTKVQIEQTI